MGLSRIWKDLPRGAVSHEFDGRRMTLQSEFRLPSGIVCMVVRHRWERAIEELASRQGLSQFAFEDLQPTLDYLCGYVIVAQSPEKSHELEEWGEAPGGITFSQAAPRGGWVVGFDCAHGWNTGKETSDEVMLDTVFLAIQLSHWGEFVRGGSDFEEWTKMLSIWREEARGLLC